jgi:predicted unusual protein kinase regulating ubiquinone biosynthesis (AarF/ABC1/UbiB family)
LDFRLEAEHAARFRQQFLDDPGIRIPAVVWELSARRVLCLDYVPGIKINDRPALLAAGIDPAAVAEKGAASYSAAAGALRLLPRRSPSGQPGRGQ